MVLAGGASRRFGGKPKGLELVGGRRIVDRVAEVLRTACDELVLAANDADAGDWLPGVAVLPDRIKDAGGLAGVEAALGGGSDVLVVAWDMPFVTAAVLELILSTARSTRAAVVVPESVSPFGFEPFCAFYSAGVSSELTSFLMEGGRAPRDFLERTNRVERLPLEEVRRIGDPTRLFLSVNTAEDLARARAAATANAAK